MRIVIAGGGIIGLSSAYYLIKTGHAVTLIDKTEQSQGCSFGNAGMVVPSHFIPLASPGMITKGIRWMFDSQSPFYIKPRFDFDLVQWGIRFYKHANEKHVRNSISPLRDLHRLSKSLYQQWARDLNFDFGYQEKGLLMLYQTSSTEREEIETAHRANEIGIEARILSASLVQELEPDVKVKVRGGIYYPGDAHLTPQSLVVQLKNQLETNGVQFVKEEVTGFETHNSKLTKVITPTNSYDTDEVVIASGIWSTEMARQLKINLPMQAGKGYSFTLNNVEKNTRIPSILLEARVAVTPMGSSLRFGGTMEIAGINSNINMNRVKGIVNAIPSYYPEMKISMPNKENVWSGLRPCPPDGLPYIGRSRKISNLVFATGHSMMGLSLGPATGKLVQQIIDKEIPVIEIAAFNPTRFN
jgi:D-amino-acid dehydrogenase